MKTICLLSVILSLLFAFCSDTVDKISVSGVGSNTAEASLVIDEKACTKCDKCTNACPRAGKALLKMVAHGGETIYVIDPDQCLRCGLCIDRCPFGAIIWKH